MPWTGKTGFLDSSLVRRRQPALLLACLLACLLLAGCISSVSPDLPLTELPAASLTSPAGLLASSAHLDSTLPGTALAAGDSVEIVGRDPVGGWLLVFDGRRLGWLPGDLVDAAAEQAAPPVVIEPPDASCTAFLGATSDPAQPWRTQEAGQVIVTGAIFRLAATPDFVDAALIASVSGGGKAMAADYLSLPLTADTSLVLFAYAFEELASGSEVTFLLDDPAREPLTFQAAFFADHCNMDWGSMGGRFASQLPIGEASLEIPGSAPAQGPQQLADAPVIRPITPKATPTRRPPTPAPTPTRRPPRATATPSPPAGPSRAEIQRLVDEWDRIHHEADYSLDGSELDAVLTGDALRQQQKTLQSLRSTKCYWDFADLAPSQITGWDEVSGSEVIVTMRKHWDGRLYCNGKFDQKGSFDDPFDVRYRIVRTQAGWRIAEKVPLDE